MKNEKTTWVFVFQKLSGHFIDDHENDPTQNLTPPVKTEFVPTKSGDKFRYKKCRNTCFGYILIRLNHKNFPRIHICECDSEIMIKLISNCVYLRQRRTN